MEIRCALLLMLVSFASQAKRADIKLGADATLILERVPFKTVGKTLEFYNSKQPNASKSLVSIGGEPVLGTDGELPKYVLRKAVLLLNGRRYNLQVSNMYNPWFGEGLKYGPSQKSARLLKKKSTYQVQAIFSDGAGSYRAEWVIANKISRRTKLSADDQFVSDYYSENNR